jgi:LacI family transcriptional regulator
LRSVARLGLEVPRDIGVAFHSLDEARNDLSGMKKNSYLIGVMAIDLLIDMLHRNERGLPETPYRMMVEGRWWEGTTLRPALELASAG